MLYAVIRKHGPQWDSSRSMREQQLWDEHAAFMDDLTEEGFVVLGGPLRTTTGALLIIDAEDETTIQSRLDADPWSPGSLLQTGMIEPWTILLGNKQAILR